MSLACGTSSGTGGPGATAPVVLSTVPDDDASGVPVSVDVRFVFDSALDAATVTTSSVLLEAGSRLVAGSVSYDAAARTVRFVPAAALEVLTRHEARITAGVTGANGLPLARTWRFSFTTGPDVTSPSILATTPVEGAVGVATSAAVSATFDEALDPSSVTSDTFLLSQGGTPVTGAVAYDPFLRTATFTPGAALSYLAPCTATFTTGILDAAGNAMPAPFSWSFTVQPDTDAPTVASRAPAAGAVDVPVDARVTVAFDEQMDPASLTTSSFSVTAGGAPVPGTVIYDAGTLTATFAPAFPLPSLASCDATVTSEATDLAGNPLASAVSWTFTVEVDTTPPRVVGVFPPDGATDVSVETAVFVSFSEDVDTATVGAATLRMWTEDGPVDAIVSYDPFSRSAHLFPDASNHVAGSTRYTVEVTDGIADAAGNYLAAGRTWSFTTGPDLVPPTVMWTYPAEGATELPTRTMVHVCFDEPMSVAATAMDVDGVPTTFHAISPNCVARDMTFREGAAPTITATTAAQDLAGNALAAPYSWTFRIVPDLTPPAIVATSPVDGARFVSAGVPGLSVSFSEPMDPASVVAAFTVTGVSGTIALQHETQAVFTPSTPLDPGTVYTATISTAAKDLAGNPLASAGTFSFGTAPATTSRLGVQSLASARAPVIAFDRSGNAMAAWIIDTGTGASLATSYRPVGQGWGREQIVDVAPEGWFADLNLVPQGNRFGLGYVRSRSRGYPEATVRFATADAWDAGTVVGSDDGPKGLRLVAGATTWIAAWGGARDHGTTARVWSNGTWQSALRTGGPGQGGTPLPSPFAIAAVGDTFHLVALGFGPRVDAYVWTGTWSGATMLSEQLGTYMGAVDSIAAVPGPAGIVVAWTITDNAWPATLATTAVITRVLSAGTWGPRTPLRSAVDAPASPLLVGSNPAGTVVAFSQGGALYAAVLSDGAWAVEPVPGGDGAPVALVASDSAFAIAWNGGAAASVSIRGATWDTPLQAPGASSLALAASSTGFAWAFGGAATSSAIVYSGGAWGSPSPLESATAGLAIASSGAGYGMVWGHGTALNAADSSTGWSSVNLVSRSYPASAFDPRVAVSGARAVMVWRQHDASSGIARAVPYAACFDGATWSTPLALDAHAERLGDVLATGPEGFAVSWIDGSGTRKLKAYSFATRAWAATSEIASSSSTSVLAVAHTGSEYLAAFDEAGELLLKRSPDGSAWSPAVGLAPAEGAKVVAGGGVAMLVAWGGGSSPVTARRYAGEGAWDPPEMLGTLLPTNNAVSAAANGLGGVGVAFDAGVPTDRAGFVVRVYESGTWAGRYGHETGLGWVQDRAHPRISGTAGGWLHTSTGTQGHGITARLVTAAAEGPPVALRTTPADHSPASSGSSQCALLTENAASPGSTGPVVYCFAGASYSAAAPLDAAPGYFADALLSADPTGSAMLAGWTRADPTTAARVLMAAFAP